MSDMNMGSTVTTLPQDMITPTSNSITGGIMIGSSNYTSYTNSTATSTLTITTSAQELLDRREMNLIVVDHKISEMEMLKLKEVQLNSILLILKIMKKLLQL